MAENVNGVRWLFFISDLHSGSSLALCPPGFRVDGGQRIGLSDIQKCYWAHWSHMINEWLPTVTQGEPFAVIVNGDAVEGNHHKNVQVWSPNEDDHVRCAAQLLMPLRNKAEYMFLIRGTEAHVGAGGKLEEALARVLHADVGQQPIERMGEIQYADDDTDQLNPIPVRSHYELWIRLGAKLIHSSHHIGCTSSTAYELSALSRELAGSLQESAQWGDEPADVMIRSHRHRFSFGGIPNKKGTARIVITPAWQACTSFSYRIGANMRRPQLGGVVIGLDETGDIIQKEYVWGLPRITEINLPLTKAAVRTIMIKPSSPKARPSPTKKKKAKPRKKSRTK